MGARVSYRDCETAFDVHTKSTVSLWYVVDAIGEHNAGLLDELQGLVDEKRKGAQSETQAQSKDCGKSSSN
jgi:hypothetical protein